MDRDLIIVGGGPSGLSTALHLQRIAPHLAPRILILEKARYPRLKLCAGGLVPDAELILQRLGLDTSEVPHVDVEDIHFDFEGRGLKIRIPKRHALRVIRRDEFDSWLATKVRDRGMEIREGITVRNIVPDKDGITVETDQGRFRAQVVVGADGSNGITRRCIFPGAPVYTARVLEVLTPSQPSPKFSEFGGGQGRGPAAYFDFFPVPDNIAGYVWDFPTQVRGEPMRCWGIYDTNILANKKRPQLKEPLAQEMSRLGFDLNDYEIKGHPIRWFSPRNEMSVPRVLLVGDTVGADPLFGEGISIALGYGAVAARVICDAIRRNDFSFRDYRRRVLLSPLGQTLLARWFTAYIVYPIKWKWFQILAWRIMKPIAKAAAWMFVLNWGKRMRPSLPVWDRGKG
ncbi:MAG TPA: NAD(P)/FAD-dependent oxidoreductase [Anaerolineales bacterium]|nr:NAD(P)/FAD-dependent oxidoreductase [Anaerolineales bacterium]